MAGQPRVFSMNLNLNNKKVLVTGASRGIGLAISETFLEEGANVCMVSRGSDQLYVNEKKLQDTFGLESIFTYACDCSVLESLDSLLNKVEEKWSELDVVIVNVGNGESVKDPFPETKEWERTWNNNFESALQTARIFLPMLIKNKGSLLFVSSIAGIEAFGAPTEYSTAKAAVIALAKNLSRKLASEGVRVNVIAPGNVYFDGGSWDSKLKEDEDFVHEIIRSNVPMNRFATPKEIADSAVFLSSDRAQFITGATLVIDGGQTIGI